MKKILRFLKLTVVLGLVLSITALANMAAPAVSDIGSAITFQKNESISVIHEILNITVKGTKADITAIYTMKNTTSDPVNTASMFLSPNIGESGVSVKAGNKKIDFVSESYALSYSTEITTDNWQYAVLTNENEPDGNSEQTVDAVTFELAFLPGEQYDVEVSYSYALGGYPGYDYNAKCGRINYYLAPAAMWKDFSDITINLYLDEDMPVLKNSNLQFKKIESRHYQYRSNTLPSGNLTIDIDENVLQNFFSSLKSPYLVMNLLQLLFFYILYLVIAVVIAGTVLLVVKIKK